MKKVEKFITDRRQGVIYRCPENVVDEICYDRLLLTALRQLDEHWTLKEQTQLAQGIEINPKIVFGNTQCNTEMNILHEMSVEHHLRMVERFPSLHLAFMKVSELTRSILKKNKLAHAKQKKENEEQHEWKIRLVNEDAIRKRQLEFARGNDYPDERYQAKLGRYLPARVAEGEDNIDDQTGLPCPAHPCHTTNTDDYVWAQAISIARKADWPTVCDDFPDSYMITAALAQTIAGDGCRIANSTHTMWVPFETFQKNACRHMKNPPPATQDGADCFYRQLVQSDFMILADETRTSIGLEALHLIQDLLDHDFQIWQFQERRHNVRTDKTVLAGINRCLGKYEFMNLREVTPRYIRCTMQLQDVSSGVQCCYSTLLPDRYASGIYAGKTDDDGQHLQTFEIWRRFAARRHDSSGVSLLHATIGGCIKQHQRLQLGMV